MKSYQKVVLGQLFILSVLFQFLPNRAGGCGMGCHPGTNYGWPLEVFISFHSGAGLSSENFGEPQEQVKFFYSELAINISIIIGFFLLTAWVTSKFKHLVSWSSLQLKVNLSLFTLFILLNVYLSVFYLNNLEDARQASLHFYRGGPIPQTHRYFSIDSFNLIIAFIVPLILANWAKYFNKKSVEISE